MAKKLAHTVKALLGGTRDARDSRDARNVRGTRGSGKRGTRGESLTEVLVAVTIGGLALIILAMAISVSSHMAMDSRSAMDRYYTANNAAVAGSSESLGTGTVSLTPEGGAGSVAIVSGSQPANVTYYGNDAVGASGIVMYDTSASAPGGGA